MRHYHLLITLRVGASHPRSLIIITPIIIMCSNRHNRLSPRSPGSTITSLHDRTSEAEASKMEEALKAGEGLGSQRPVYPAESEEASDGAALPPGPKQTPASVEGPVGSPLNRTPGTMTYIKAVDCDVRPRPMGIQAMTRSTESVDGHIWPCPMRTPRPLRPMEAFEGPVSPRLMGSSVSMPSVGWYHGLPEEHRSPESGNQPLPELAIDEQEYWRQQQGGKCGWKF
ncbi:hypothetical protein HPB51_003694 [Rhipicephalus microplus]|uniref:Uncharacterized protein n=1 Tax=Rhipicephalus microplus TaxID=6941 RepID=A0A9J6EEX0_RHIMP|nr:hypothetical protein HPB51_003694 [Rhipicephalus microplus]